MKLTQEVFDASLHRDRVTMFGPFCSCSNRIQPTNKQVTVCSFTTRSLVTMLHPSYSGAVLRHSLVLGKTKGKMRPLTQAADAGVYSSV